ncbi:MAG: hypothetical protein GC151_08835 [Betaproteobacteria bacterium]|nr:hypothetical protein [Betaproteobacteria bacterium]
MNAAYADLSEFTSPSVDATPGFMGALEQFRSRSAEASWKEFVRTSPLVRQWRFFLSHDPYTRWGLVKPRGYPGDATLMDFAYRHPSVERHVADASTLGRSIYEITQGAPQSRSARDRVDMMRKRLVEADSRGPVHVVSLACGHARELENLDNEDIEFGSITFLDNDPLSLSIASTAHDAAVTRPIRINVVKEPLPRLPEAHIVYAMGLFDYLTDTYATDVTRKMLALLKPGGSCIIGNLDPGAANLGYCEAMMDWWMIVRDSQALLDLGKTAASAVAGTFSCTVERSGCFNYLTIART